jgi:hypothetical protein
MPGDKPGVGTVWRDQHRMVLRKVTGAAEVTGTTALTNGLPLVLHVPHGQQGYAGQAATPLADFLATHTEDKRLRPQ